MQNLTPVPHADRPALLEFTPVPRQYRHDGWTPERQKAFIAALADTGCVRRAATMVNMAQTNCYTLRRAPGAEAFRRAWEAALDFGVQRLKDVAFERAIEGELIPVFVAGKLMGFRRKRNDALLMFCLRHYGQDAAGRRTTINYFSSRASAGGGAGGGAAGGGDAVAETATTTLRTVVTGAGDGACALGRDDALTATLNGFDGVALDAEAEEAVMAALAACAERQRADDAVIKRGGERAADILEDDPMESFVRLPHNGSPYRGTLISPVEFDTLEPGAETHWTLHGAEILDWDRPEHGDGTEPTG